MGVNLDQTSVICFHQGFSYCPYHWDVRYSGAFARREITVLSVSSLSQENLQDLQV